MIILPNIVETTSPYNLFLIEVVLFWGKQNMFCQKSHHLRYSVVLQHGVDYPMCHVFCSLREQKQGDDI